MNEIKRKNILKASFQFVHKPNERVLPPLSRAKWCWSVPQR